ncbi:MAG: hypothetical protein ACK5TO_15765 [Planctomycetaceae bacterium]
MSSDLVSRPDSVSLSQNSQLPNRDILSVDGILAAHMYLSQ